MKRSQLKALVKECVREIILEEGLLKTIVTEVAEGLNAGLVVESRQAPAPSHEQNFRKQMNDSRKKVIGSIGKSGYEDAKRKFDNPALFEGTKPIADSRSPIGVDPSSAGVGIENIPGMSNWGNILDKMNKRK